MKTILLTGFEAFADHSSNPSQDIALAFHDQEIGHAKVISRILPVDGNKAPKMLSEILNELEPDAVLMLGLAAGRSQIALERVALNVLEYRTPDNAGATRRGERVLEGAGDAIFSSLPISEILSIWHDARIPAYVSDSAGTYLCNQIMFLARALRPNIPAGFVHLPADETLALRTVQAFVPLEFQIRAVRLALEVMATLNQS
jgi:pyroglutamyl-peptidase